MNELMSIKHLCDFVVVLEAYKKAKIDLHNALDGGAGWGETSNSIAKVLKKTGKVYAFEPFIGNHKFFKNYDKRIVLVQKALAENNQKKRFIVNSSVSEDSVWGRRGMTGYSSLGHICRTEQESLDVRSLEVEGVRADDEIPVSERIGFVKLDLQGGELNALKGMPRIVENALFLWIEYIGDQPSLLQYIVDQNYMVFDTEYLFIGEPSEEAREWFDVSKQNIVLSTNVPAWYGFKKKPWNHFESEFAYCKKKFQMVQTDFLCINKAYVDAFSKALKFI